MLSKTKYNKIAACTKWHVGAQNKTGNLSYHNQAPHPGNIWHNRSGSIASCKSCWTYKNNSYPYVINLSVKMIKQSVHQNVTPLDE